MASDTAMATGATAAMARPCPTQTAATATDMAMAIPTQTNTNHFFLGAARVRGHAKAPTRIG